MGLSDKQHLFRSRGEGHGDSAVTPIELFFDLVFVFAITQLSHRLLEHLTPVGAVETLILLLAVWWAWVYTGWCTNWLDPERGAVRLLLIGVMLAALVLAVAVPDAFAKNGWMFVAAYLVIQIGRTGYMVWAFHTVRPAGARNFMRITAYFLLSMPLWIWGATLDAEARLAAWTAALAIEYAGPFLFFRFPGLGRSLGSDWDISGAHMAERCSLFIIIALGEAILITGATFATLAQDAITWAALASCFFGSVAMWWIYFDIGAKRATSLIEHSEQAGLIARNAYTYLHIPIVAAIIITAVGDDLVLTHPTGHVDLPFLLTSVGGPWLFLMANMLFKWSTWDSRYPPLSHGIGMLLLVALGIWGWLAQPQPLTVALLSTAALLVTAVWEWLSLHGGWQRWAPWLARGAARHSN